MKIEKAQSSKNPSKLPESSVIDKILEPYINANIMCPNDYVGPLMELCQKKTLFYIKLQILNL